MQTFIRFIITSILTALLVGCQTTGGVSRAYRDAVASNRKLDNRRTTTLLILVDGLSKDILTSSLREKRVPALRSFFSLGTGEGFKFQLARAAFPSLTYPNLTSILTGSGVSQHGIIGNRISFDGSVLNFESVLAWDTLDQLVSDRTIFSRLREKNLTSVSYSYPFPLDTTAHIEKSIEAGIQYIDERYDEIDRHSIESLDYLLTRTEVDTWPRFIFLHLIGIDALSHQYGPEDGRVVDYMEALDHQLARVFSTLETQTEESEQHFNVVLTSDHGSQTIKKSIDISSLATRLDPNIDLIQDNRIATLKFPDSYSLSAKRGFAKELLQVKDLQATILKTPDGPETFSRSETSLTSNEDLLWPAIEDYFKSPNAPDLLLLPKSHIDFSPASNSALSDNSSSNSVGNLKSAYAGNHGGFTVDEMLVPLLVHDIKIPDENFPTSDLLKILGLLK